MHFTGTTYRPPMEAMLGAKFLQVSIGCPHNKCRFCNMYRSVKYSISPMSEIEEDIKELRQTYSKIERIYLVNGDPFFLPAKYLQEICKKIIQNIPEINTISMYCSIKGIKNKSDEELLMLKELRVRDLWIGAETGNAQNLEYINKNNSLQDIYEQCERLNRLGIVHNHSYILGVGGHGRGMENAYDTAKLINATKPASLFVCSLGIFEGSEMPEEVESGRFTPATEGEILEEEKKLIELIDVDGLRFYAIHPTNALSVQGILPAYRELMITQINTFIQNADSDFLHSSSERDAD